MTKRRFAKVATIDVDGDAPVKPPPSHSEDDQRRSKRKRKEIKYVEDEKKSTKKSGKVKKTEEESRNEKKIKQIESSGDEYNSEDEYNGEGDEEEEEVAATAIGTAKPIGEPFKSSGRGKKHRDHFKEFKYCGTIYRLDNSVLLFPETHVQKPYIAIIKDIMQDNCGNVMILGQWFYRPEDTKKKGGGNWSASDTRELFYSFHRDEVAAEAIMYKTVVHFIPLNKQIPNCKEHAGYIVQRVYDTKQMKLFQLTDKVFDGSKQHEIDLLVQKTFARLGDVPDIEAKDGEVNLEGQLRCKRLLRRKNMTLLDVSRSNKETTKSGQSSQCQKAEPSSEYRVVLADLKVLTGEVLRDSWLERLLQSVQYICTPSANSQVYGGENVGTGGKNVPNLENANATEGRTQNEKTTFNWPDVAVPAVVALEKASYEALFSDFQKYNKMMWQLQFSLKSNAQITRRLLSGELDPVNILNMSSIELKEGLTAEKIASKEPEEFAHMQMTNACCKRCPLKKVCLIDIIQAGNGYRYQLKCIACGNTWSASRNEVSSLSINEPSIEETTEAEPAVWTS